MHRPAGVAAFAGEAGGVTVRITCRDDLAVVVQGSAELATGRAGTWAMALDHTTGQWLVVEQGAALAVHTEPSSAPPSARWTTSPTPPPRSPASDHPSVCVHPSAGPRENAGPALGRG